MGLLDRAKKLADQARDVAEQAKEAAFLTFATVHARKITVDEWRAGAGVG